MFFLWFEFLWLKWEVFVQEITPVDEFTFLHNLTWTNAAVSICGKQECSSVSAVARSMLYLSERAESLVCVKSLKQSIISGLGLGDYSFIVSGQASLTREIETHKKTS